VPGWRDAENLVPMEIHPARSKSLYQLRYPRALYGAGMQGSQSEALAIIYYNKQLILYSI
jgi:hypothetical protein